jgi:hypothetical protein
MLAAACRAIPARTRAAPSAGPTGSGPAGTRSVPHGSLTSGYSANADRPEEAEDVVAQVGR